VCTFLRIYWCIYRYVSVCEYVHVCVFTHVLMVHVCVCNRRDRPNGGDLMRGRKKATKSPPREKSHEELNKEHKTRVNNELRRAYNDIWSLARCIIPYNARPAHVAIIKDHFTLREVKDMRDEMEFYVALLDEATAHSFNSSWAKRVGEWTSRLLY